MTPWELWKQGFDAWEAATADYLDKLLKHESTLGPAGTMLTLAMKTKAATDKALATWWGAVGLPTKRDQERSLHKLNQMESRLLDLEEMLEDARRSAKVAGAAPAGDVAGAAAAGEPRASVNKPR